MAQEYYNLAKAAEVLGITPAEVNKMREQNELHAYRDGAGWKFKKEDIDGKLAEKIKGRSSKPKDDDDLLLADFDSGDPDEATMLADRGSLASLVGADEDSSSLINSDDDSLDFEQSDLMLSSDDDLILADVSEDSDLILTDSDVDTSDPENETVLRGLDDDEDTPQIQMSAGDSSINISDSLDDDDLVLGSSGSDLRLGGDSGISLLDPSGSGSDLSLGNDSGISIIDPSGSGFSLDDPVEILNDDGESLELGEDDMLSLGEEDIDTDTSTELQAVDDFNLSAGDDGDDDASESSSQVIALESDDDMDDLFGGLEIVDESPAAVLEPETTDLGLEAELSAASGPAPLGGMGDDMAIGFEPVDSVEAAPAPAVAAMRSPNEPNYTGTTVWLWLFPCILLLSLCMMLAVDLVRNIWSWDQEFTLNSSIMEMILSLVGG